ncbi:MAG: iron ABC transporter permease [Hyphomicrobiales bacterium]|nr:iron ABC transporter permease [Hyphomicrobiales bacterium]MBV9518009.1 iron ABC transporter permease [Hyphomicrobiales bacterium]
MTALAAFSAKRSRAARLLAEALSGRGLFMALLLAGLAFLIILPVFALVIGSFLPTPPRALAIDWSGLSLANYREILAGGGFLALLRVTLSAAVIGTAGALIIGTSLAWLAIRTDVPGRTFLENIAILPMFVPPLVGAFAWDILASPRSGIINIALRSIGLEGGLNIYSFGGIGFVFAIYYAPYVHLFVAAALRNIDPVHEEAAAMCGASRWRCLLQITLPLVSPALLSSGLLVFVLLIELFAIPAILGEPGNLHFISVRIWEMVGFTPPKVNQASALGVLMLVITVTLVLIQYRVLGKRSFTTVSGKGLRPDLVTLGAARWPLALLGFGYILFVVLMPYAALLFIALRKNLFYATLGALVDIRQISLDQFGLAFSDPVVRASFVNSLLVSFGTVAIGSVIYFTVAYVVHRTRLAGRRALDLIAVLPVAIPGLIIGLGYLWTWISLPIGIYGTLWIIILAYVSQFSPQGVRAISGSLMQIDPELEESSRLCGAGLAYTLRRIVVPLAWPGILSAIILLLILSFRELATALFLYTSTTQVFSLTMFDFWLRGSTNLVAAMALAQTLVLALLVLLARRIRRERTQFFA